MKRWFLAAILLLTSAGLTSADYVIIIANVGANKEAEAQAGSGIPGYPGAGATGGYPSSPQPGGVQPGGVRPGGVQPGGVQPGMGPYTMRPGMASGTGMRGMAGGAGMRGMAGGMGMRGMGGGMMGMAGGFGMMGMGEPTDVDDVPYFITVVVEVESIGDLAKKLEDPNKGFAKVKLPPRLGETCDLLHKTDFAETIVLKDDSNHKPLPTTLRRFNDKFKKTFDTKPSTELVLELADWTLGHGLVDKFPQVMDKLVEIDKGHPAAVAYLKVKADLDRPLTADDTGAAWRGKLLNGYKATEGPHYTVVHHSTGSGKVSVQSHLELLENSFRGFYYWFALKSVALPVPKQRQLVVITTGQDKDFQHLRKILTSGPVVVDGFFARRENVAVMTDQRQDETYDVLNKYWKNWEDKGFRHNELLRATGKKKGYPVAAEGQVALIYTAEMLALMLKALQQESELATISHDASRQLLFSSGLLPRNVAAPEWLLFGMGSFFETPLQSPWPGIGAPSAYYLPRWQELKNKGFEKESGATLRQVVTDAYFRGLPPEGPPDTPLRHAHDLALRKARTSSWSLTYFLAKQKLDGLQRYFKELSRMPRDIELDDEVLLGCFARAFGKVDAGNKPDKAKLAALEKEWFSYVGNIKFESESTMKKIRETFQKKLKESQAAAATAGQGPIDPTTGRPFAPALTRNQALPPARCLPAAGYLSAVAANEPPYALFLSHPAEKPIASSITRAQANVPARPPPRGDVVLSAAPRGRNDAAGLHSSLSDHGTMGPGCPSHHLARERHTAQQRGTLLVTRYRLLAGTTGLLAVLAVAALQAEDKKPSHSAVKAEEHKGKGPEARHQRFLERAKKGGVEVLFLGDSITQGWEGNGKDVWKKYFEPLKAANFGIGGDRTQHVLWRITEGKELEGIAPKASVLMIGTNNMSNNSVEEIADGVQAIVAELRRQKPDMKVLLLGIFPRAAKADDKARGKIKDVNGRLAKLDDGKHVKYLDIGDKFLESDGSLSKNIMYDYLHLTPKGYQIWADAMGPTLEGMLKK